MLLFFLSGNLFLIHFEPLSGHKITVALGQRGSSSQSGCGGTFVITYHEIYKGAREPIFVAGGAAADAGDPSFSKASLNKIAHGNNKVGSSGTQTYIPKKWVNNEVYCAGAGFLDAPRVGNTVRGSDPPENYSQGLKGGTGKFHDTPTEGGFGGGGACYRYADVIFGKYQEINYFGAGGGFTGGSTKLNSYTLLDCFGGGGGSYSYDRSAAFDHAFEVYGKCKIELIK